MNECDEHDDNGHCIGESGSYFVKIPIHEVDDIWDLEVGDVGGPGDEGVGVIEWMINRNMLEYDGYGIEYVIEIDIDEFCEMVWYKNKDICPLGMNLNESNDFDWTEDIPSSLGYPWVIINDNDDLLKVF